MIRPNSHTYQMPSPVGIVLTFVLMTLEVGRLNRAADVHNEVLAIFVAGSGYTLAGSST